jgi:hypothetical protein
MDDDLHFDSAGKPLGTYKTGSFTESAFDAKEVKVSNGHLVIEGQRVAVAFTKEGNAERLPLTKSKLFGTSPEKLTITIDGQGDTDFGKELDAVFASHLYEIAASRHRFQSSGSPLRKSIFYDPARSPAPRTIGRNPR